MTFEIAIDFSQLLELRFRQMACFGPRRVKQRRRMTFGKNEAVIGRIVWSFGVKTHVPEEKGRDQLRSGAARSGMTAARSRRGADGFDSEAVRYFLKFLKR